MIGVQGKNEIHISCCAGFILKHKDIFVFSLSFLDTEMTKWTTVYGQAIGIHDIDYGG